MEIRKLKSGTDIRGVASDVCGKEINLTNDVICSLSSAFAVWLSKYIGVSADKLVIAVGHDSRISANRIKECVINSLKAAGVRVLDCGLSSTPAMFMTTVDAHTHGAIQITASHHPSDRNGLKFFTKDSGINGSQLDEIISLAEQGAAAPECNGEVIVSDFMSVYAKRLRKLICDGIGKSEKDLPLKNYKIVVDAGNGAGGFYVDNVLKPLGADTTGSRYLEPDGMFPNHIPNPENKEAMQSICDAVKESKADLGIIFDTDVDRAGCVDCFGNEINRNRLVALASIIALQGHNGGTIVTDSVTSDGLKEFINNEIGGVHYRYKRGYRNVIDKAVELCESGIDCPLAIETSGHAAFKENFFLDDGAYLVTRIVVMLASGVDIGKALEKLKMPVEEIERRFEILDENFKEYGMKVLEKLERFVDENDNFTLADDNREGIRAFNDDGWFLLRLSVHDPIMPLNIESNTVGGCEKIAEKIRPFFNEFNLLNSSSL